jgi:RimJ/RimL family protein N-acetyltransferase
MIQQEFDLPNSVLQGEFVQLEPYREDIKEEVRLALNCDAPAWDLFAMSGQGEHFATWWESITRKVQAGTWIAYAIRRLSDQKIVGTSSFLNIKAEMQTVEIGATFLNPEVRAAQANPEAKLLMLEHAFSHGVRRVELRTDLRNVRSQAAILKLGATREGILRRERIIWTGYVRDTVLFSITDDDWGAVRERLRLRLELVE